MKPTWDVLVGYCWECNQNISQIWLTNPQNLDRIPSNFFVRLILGSLIDYGTGWRTCWLTVPLGFWGAGGAPTWSY
jgi:hypothetical protein